MRKNKPAEKKNDFHTGLTGENLDDIPAFCLVANRKPLTAAQQAKLDASMANTPHAQGERFDGRKPKGMDWATWDTLQAQEANKRTAINAEKFSALPQPSPRARLRKAEGMLDANHFGKLCGCHPKLVRRALRTTKALPKPAAGWVFTQADAAKVVAVVNAYLVKKGVKQEEPKAEAAPKKVQPAKAKRATK